ncbi:MAG: CopG family transcriptional regulator [Hyperthermus sp.]|nr:MAG: CopG family transcriptional regulator [Hyperthermus sp.]
MHRIVTFKIDESLLYQLDKYAKSRRMTRSEAIREAIMNLLAKAGYNIAKEKTTILTARSRSPIIEVPV